MSPGEPAAPAEDPWGPYVPDAGAPWDLRRVVHLHRRADFAATWEELQRDLADGPEPSLRRLLDGQARLRGVPEGFEATSRLLADAAVASRDPGRLKAWWAYRMLLGPDPLGERLTSMWHDHFATSNEKVDDLALMRQQNETFREHARAPFGTLLAAVVRDPALMVWLDAPANRKGHPNENLARELMELFTLGVGHYTEDDVKQAARTLTGWSVADGRFCEDPLAHDDGEKAILGRVGRWRGGDLTDILLAHPATADRLALRLCGLFLGEGAVDPVGVASLADDLRRHDLDVGRGVATILRSRAFFAEANLGTRVLGPVEFVIGAVRALELFDPPPSTLVLADWMTRLGQDLFYPPNVGGWPGGRAWLTTRTLVGRANFAASLADGTGLGFPEPLDASALAGRYAQGHDDAGTISFFSRLFLGAEPDPGLYARIAAATGRGNAPPEDRARRAVVLILASPEAQLA